MRHAVVAVLVAALVGAGAFVGYRHFFGHNTFTAYFRTATAIYAGDDVRVAGIKVGEIASIEASGTQVKMVLKVDRDVPIPVDAKAVVVAQSVIAPRYVQLTPSYRTSGPRMADGARIPLERTAVPVEWDEVKTQLTRLAAALGPDDASQTGTFGRVLQSSAGAFEGNGAKFHQTLSQLSGVAKVLGDGSGNIVDVIKNLQIFVSALKGSNQQILEFEDRFATLTSVVDENKSDLDAALTNLSVAIDDVQRFVREHRGRATEQIRRLGSATQVLVDSRMDLEQVLHVAPTELANFNNIYMPDSGSVTGAFVLNDFANPVTFLCSAIASVENVTSAEGAKLCAQYLGPALRYVAFNYLPFPVNPLLGPTAKPENLIYTEPRLVPGGPDDVPAEPEPAIGSPASGAASAAPAPAAPASGGPPPVSSLLLPGQETP